MRTSEGKSKGKVFLITVAMFAVGICLVVPVWQSAVHTQLVARINGIQAKISSYERTRMTVQADIAHRTTPEYLIEQAVHQNINFARITDTTSVALLQDNR